MKEMLKDCDISSIIMTSVYKVTIFICWYLYAFMFLAIINDDITNTKLLILVISLTAIYFVRNFLKNIYKDKASKSYQNIKHSVEMHYFSKFEHLEYKEIEKLDKKEISKKILEVSYNVTKLISDIGEYIIPCILGCLILFIKLTNISIILGVFMLVLLTAVIFSSYDSVKIDDSCKNYNDLLTDFIDKMLTIRRLNVFNFCYRVLDSNETDDFLVLTGVQDNDTKFGNKLFVVIMLMLISVFVFVRNTVDLLGTILFMLVIIIKLFDLIYQVNPFIKNFFKTLKDINELDLIFRESREIEYVNTFKKASIKDVKIKYESADFELKIPDFEILNKDHIDIMGKSGQGKSTVLNIISGLFEVNEGSLLIDGNISKKYISSFYVTPTTEIFNMSLRDNLLLGEVKKDEELLELINEVSLNDWYKKLSDGLDTIISDNVFDDVRAKINILRAIISNRSCYLFDNPTYNLDVDTEKSLSAIIKKHFKDKTYIIVSNQPIITTICKKHFFIKDRTLKSKEPLL